MFQLHEKCMDYEVEGTRPKGTPKKTWTEIVEETVLPNNQTMMQWTAVNTGN